jgi:hypothetical protein
LDWPYLCRISYILQINTRRLLLPLIYIVTSFMQFLQRYCSGFACALMPQQTWVCQRSPPPWLWSLRPPIIKQRSS